MWTCPTALQPCEDREPDRRTQWWSGVNSGAPSSGLGQNQVCRYSRGLYMYTLCEQHIEQIMQLKDEWHVVHGCCVYDSSHCDKCIMVFGECLFLVITYMVYAINHIWWMRRPGCNSPSLMTRWFCFAVNDGLELRPKYSGLIHCVRSVWRQEGLRGLYQGVTPNVWGAGASWGLYFLLYVQYNHPYKFYISAFFSSTDKL